MSADVNAPAGPPRAPVPYLLSGYRPVQGVADEMIDGAGKVRPVWQPLLDHLSRLAPEEVDEHFARGTNYLNDAGVYFRQYSTTPTPERAWPLNPVPVLIHEGEWATICEGLRQRADLLERVMADLYGPGDLVAQGHLPAELIARSPAWLRPLVSTRPASGHYLHHLSFEISRNPDGTWFVLGDRTQAPSGAGFALENRIATARIYNDMPTRAHIHRLAGFFRAFREAMDALPTTRGRRTAIVTPGPNNASYFEHTYIARYLGLLLLEGEDMIVRDGQVMVRTVEGPEPLGALWRRVDGEYMDPLELREDSQLGTPGLVNALRHGSVEMINALGSGVLEMRAMMAFLPKIAEVLTGEALRLPNIATWWCGQPAERDYVKANTGKMMIGGALDQDLPLDIGATTALGGTFRSGARASVADWIDEEGPLLVGQEVVNVSTAPAWVDGALVPRPMTVRVTAARTPTGWHFMPGGYARFGATEDATALGMQRGGSVADVWIVGDTPRPQDSLIKAGGLHRVDPEPLPSRAAENLYWLGRYVERIETAFRLVRAYHLRLAETGDAEDLRLLRLADHMKPLGIEAGVALPDQIAVLLGAAQACAGKVRDRFSTDGWSALQDLAKTCAQMTQTARPGDDAARAMGILLRKITGFSGLVNENMYRFSGWRFLAFGRALERADTLGSILIAFADPEAPLGAVEIAVELGDSSMTHRRRFRGAPSPASVHDLLACDPLNPRSILFQLNEMVEIAASLPNTGPMPGPGTGSEIGPETGRNLGREGRPSELARVLLPLQTQFAVADPAGITPDALGDLRGALAQASDLLWSLYLR